MHRYYEGGVRTLVILSLAPDAPRPTSGLPMDNPPWFSEEWWEIAGHACAVAENLGMKLWYDDHIGVAPIRPIADLVDANPIFTARILGRAPRGETAPAGAEVVAIIGDYVYFHQPGPNPGGSLDVFRCDICQPAAAAALMDVTHGPWERHLGRFLGKVIVGSYMDELRPLPTWTPALPASFRRRTGEDLIARLPDLFDSQPQGASIRVAYRQTLAELAENAFFRPLYEWHTRHGMLVSCDQIRRTRHGDPLVGSIAYHDYPRTHRWFSAPGNDHNGQTKVHSSLAHHYGRSRVWLEAFHSSGWGSTLEETFHWLLPWLQQGVTLYHPGCTYYSTKGSWWECAPPSTCWRQPYWRHYPAFAQTIARLCSVLSQGTHVCDIGLVYPSSAIQAELPLSGHPTPEAYETTRVFWELAGNITWRWQEMPSRQDPKDRTGTFERAGQDFDVIDEDSLTAAEVRGGRIHIKDESFGVLVFPRTRCVPLAALQQARALTQTGGIVLFVGELPERAAEGPGQDARVAAILAELLPAQSRPEKGVWIQRHPGDGLVAFCRTAEEVTGFLHSHLREPVVGDVRTLHRRVDGRDLYFLVPRSTLPPPEERPNIRQRLKLMGRTDYNRLTVAGYTIELDYPEVDPSLTGTVSVWPTIPERMTVTIRQTGSVEQWDPFDGTVRPARVVLQDADSTTVDLDLSRTPAAILVFGAEPHAEAPPDVRLDATTDLGAKWSCELVPTLDNRYGDMDWPPYAGPLPVEVRRLDFHEGADADLPEGPWVPVLCSFAPFLEASGPYEAGTAPPEALERADAGLWRPYWYSPRFGIEKDPLHWFHEGPKAVVPEEFIDLGNIPAGQSYAVRTSVMVSSAISALLRVGSTGTTLAWLNGEPVGEGGGTVMAPVILPAGVSELRLILSSTGEPRLRGFFHFLPADAKPPYGHPLPEGNWLTPEMPVKIVSGLVLDPHPEVGTRVGWYRCQVPPGAHRVQARIRGAVRAYLDGRPLEISDGVAALPHPEREGRVLALRVQMPVGVLAGAAFGQPLRFECGRGIISLGEWRHQGLPHYAGGVRYRRTLDLPAVGGAVALDLGHVRGSAEVTLNGQPCGVRLWHPYRFDLTAAVRAGANDLEITVFSTLGPHFRDGHPTPYCYSGQDISGLVGPVRVLMNGG